MIVAVFLAYNANNGLPFVPTRDAARCSVANGAELVKGNEVRSGGFRVGVVDDMRPVRLDERPIGAELTLKLDKKTAPCPMDSTVRIRPRSALGLKYVELTRGHVSRRRFADGDVMPASQTSRARSSSTSSTRCSTPRRARRRRSNLRRLRRRVRRPRPGPRPHARGAAALLRLPAAGDAQPLRAGHASSTASSASSATPRASSRRSPKQNAALFTDDGRHVRGVVARPAGAKDTIAKSPSTLRRGRSRRCASSSPFLDRPAAFSPRPAARRARAARRAAAAQPRARGRHAGAAAPAALNDDGRRTLDTLRELVEAPGTDARAARPDRHGRRRSTRSCASSART